MEFDEFKEGLIGWYEFNQFMPRAMSRFDSLTFDEKLMLYFGYKKDVSNHGRFTVISDLNDKNEYKLYIYDKDGEETIIDLNITDLDSTMISEENLYQLKLYFEEIRDNLNHGVYGW